MKFLNFLFKKQPTQCCEKCGSKILENGYWIRGWNNLCNQATGDRGDRCFDCGYIKWNQSCKEFKNMLPSWCKAYC